MKTCVMLVGALMCAVLVGTAQESKTVTLTGYVVDHMCAQRMAKKSDVMQKASNHSRECALEDDCASSGFGIFSGSKYYPFDKKGSAIAQKKIEESTRTKGLYFIAKGTVEKDLLVLTSLEELTPEKNAPGGTTGQAEKKD